MNTHNKISIAFKTIVLSSSIIDSIFKSNLGYTSLIVYISLVAILLGTEVIRSLFFHNDSTWNILSIILSTLLCGFLIYNFNTSEIYIIFYYLVFFIFKRTNKKQIIILTFIHFVTFLLGTQILHYLIINKITSYEFIRGIVGYLGYIIIYYLIKTRSDERRRNKRLKLEYLEKSQDLALSEERNRIAQELHDSLGHYLMALSMNLDFIEKIIDSNPQKTKEVISKSRLLVKDSINTLRHTVYAVRNDSDFSHLEDKLNVLKDNLIMSKAINISVHYDKSIDENSNRIKSAVYKTVQEALTNGIKHGNATEFFINIYTKTNIINIEINNNGISPKTITKSNGLTGMEDRILSLGGSLDIISNNGFTVIAKIPIESGDIYD